MRMLVAVIVVAFLSSACGGGESSESSSAPSTYAPRTTTAPTSTAPSVDRAEVFDRLITDTINWLYWVKSSRKWDPTPPDTFDEMFLIAARFDRALSNAMVQLYVEDNPEGGMDTPALEFREKVDSGVRVSYQDATEFLTIELIAFTQYFGSERGLAIFLNVMGTSGSLWLTGPEQYVNSEHRSLIYGDRDIYNIIDQLEVAFCQTDTAMVFCSGG